MEPQGLGDRLAPPSCWIQGLATPHTPVPASRVLGPRCRGRPIRCAVGTHCRIGPQWGQKSRTDHTTSGRISRALRNGCGGGVVALGVIWLCAGSPGAINSRQRLRPFPSVVCLAEMAPVTSRGHFFFPGQVSGTRSATNHVAVGRIIAQPFTIRISSLRSLRGSRTACTL